MYSILVVDDEVKIRELVHKYLKYEGYEVDEAKDGREAVTLCGQNEYDLVIMDAMMPELDGISAVRMIREDSNVPIIMLTARGEEFDRIHGFKAGIDDYVVKPFSPRELMLRVAAVLKRSYPERVSKEHETFEKDGLFVDFTARVVKIDDRIVTMAPKEYELFFYMVRNRNAALPREKILTDVWGIDFYGDDRTLDSHIKMIRRALGDYSDSIVTLRGVGYRFDG